MERKDEQAGLSGKDEYLTKQGKQASSTSQNRGREKSGFQKSRGELTPQSIPSKVTAIPNTIQSPRKQTISEKYKTADNVRRPIKQQSSRNMVVSESRPNPLPLDKKRMQPVGILNRKVAASDYSPRKDVGERRHGKVAQTGGKRDKKVTFSGKHTVGRGKKQPAGRRDQKMALSGTQLRGDGKSITDTAFHPSAREIIYSKPSTSVTGRTPSEKSKREMTFRSTFSRSGSRTGQPSSKQKPTSKIHPERRRVGIAPQPMKQLISKNEILTERSSVNPELANYGRRRRSIFKERERRPGMVVPWASEMNLTKNVESVESVESFFMGEPLSEISSDKSTQETWTSQQKEIDRDWSQDRMMETDYDPHEFRQCDYQTSNAEALLLMIKVCLGTGVFTMPEAYKYAGMFYGIVSTFWVITFMTYGINTLVKCQYLLCKRLKIPSITYPDTLVAALTIGPKNLRRYARNSGIFLAFLILLNRFCNCTIYIIFVAKHLKAIIDLHFKKKLALEVYMVFLTIPLSVISSVRTIKFLAPIAMAANVCMLVSIVVILAYMVTSLPDFHETKGVGKIWDLPLALSTTMFAFDSVTSVVVLERTMKQPKAFVGFFGVFSISIVILSISFTCVGFFGYWRFGEGVKSLMTMNLPTEESICQVIMVLSASAVWASYSLQVFVPIFYMSTLLRSLPHSYAWEYLLRFCWVIFPLIFAVSVPELLKVIIPFFGSLCGPLLQFGFPALIEFCMKYSDTMTYGRWIAVVDICIIIYAVTGVVTGLHSTATMVYFRRFT